MKEAYDVPAIVLSFALFLSCCCYDGYAYAQARTHAHRVSLNGSRLRALSFYDYEYWK